MNCRQQKWNFGDSVHFLLYVWPADLAPVSNPNVSAEQFRFPGFFHPHPQLPSTQLLLLDTSASHLPTWLCTSGDQIGPLDPKRHWFRS